MMKADKVLKELKEWLKEDISYWKKSEYCHAKAGNYKSAITAHQIWGDYKGILYKIKELEDGN